MLNPIIIVQTIIVAIISAFRFYNAERLVPLGHKQHARYQHNTHSRQESCALEIFTRRSASETDNYLFGDANAPPKGSTDATGFLCTDQPEGYFHKLFRWGFTLILNVSSTVSVDIRRTTKNSRRRRCGAACCGTACSRWRSGDGRQRALAGWAARRAVSSWREG